ncbi:DedA family protein [Bacillus massilinigeriensis]|uniref:DedA family protein n=1 Tax=Bacillus mediterraneensis TaxID=1805474 RepID=UPI0008F90B0A|nr:DedA family protein [Bacillus mediterraneensis]
MNVDLVLEMMEGNGYIGLFIWLWLGIFGIPLPNEVLIMGVGFVSSTGILHPLSAFLTAYAGLIFALTTSYLMGRILGKRLLSFFRKSKRFTLSVESSIRIMAKYHAFSLSFSYFIPGVRSVIPFLYGAGGLNYRTFALYAYPGALAWLSLTFTAGFLFGDNMDDIIKLGSEYGAAFLLVSLVTLTVVIHRKRRRNRERVLDR